VHQGRICPEHTKDIKHGPGTSAVIITKEPACIRKFEGSTAIQPT